jgi:hypothetical protein
VEKQENVIKRKLEKGHFYNVVREQGTRDYGFHGNWAKKLA